MKLRLMRVEGVVQREQGRQREWECVRLEPVQWPLRGLRPFARRWVVL